jgi:hypothetical protein
MTAVVVCDHGHNDREREKLKLSKGKEIKRTQIAAREREKTGKRYRNAFSLVFVWRRFRLLGLEAIACSGRKPNNEL